MQLLWSGTKLTWKNSGYDIVFSGSKCSYIIIYVDKSALMIQVVRKEAGAAYAAEVDGIYVETSAKENINVVDLFAMLCTFSSSFPLLLPHPPFLHCFYFSYIF